MGQTELFEMMLKITLKYIDILALKILILQLRIKCSQSEMIVNFIDISALKNHYNKLWKVYQFKMIVNFIDASALKH